MSYYKLADVNMRDVCGARITLVGLIKDVTYKSTKNGAEMIEFTLFDADHKRKIVVFNVTTLIKEKLKDSARKVMNVTVDVKPYEQGEDGVSCHLFDLSENKEESIDSFIPCVSNISELVGRINTYLGYAQNTYYGKIALLILQKNWEVFTTIPAAKNQHHNLKGGLLLHSVSVADACYDAWVRYSKAYGDDFINLPLLLSAALIHDIGKCFEFTFDGIGTVEYSSKAPIENHILRGLQEVDVAATELGINISKSDEVTELKHCIASHHQLPDWGAAMRPATIEAILLSRADEQDALVNKTFKRMNGLDIGQSVTEWHTDGGYWDSCYRGLTAEKCREISEEAEEISNDEQ